MRCAVCGLSYMPDHPSDVRLHRRRHDLALNGVPARPLKSEQVIAEDEHVRITLVTPRSSITQRVRAEEVARLGRREMQYDFLVFSRYEDEDEYQAHVFLAHREGRAVGLLALRYRQVVRHYTWAEWDAEVEPGDQAFDPVKRWAIDFIWFLPPYRRQGLATRLLSTAATHMHLDVQQFAWTTPFSEAGEQLARQLSPQSFFVGF